MFDHPNFLLILKVLTATTVLLAVGQVLWTDNGNSQNYPQFTHNTYQAQKRAFSQIPIYSDDEPVPQVPKVETDEPTPKCRMPYIEDPFTLDMRLKYPKLLPSGTSISEQMLFTLKTAETPLEKRTPVDLVWVIDTSGSMGGQKLILLKDTLSYLLNRLTPQDRLSIVEFSYSGKRLTPLLPVSANNIWRFQNVINGLQADGGTNIRSGLEIALGVLKGRIYNDRVASIFLLSDGQDNDNNAGYKIRNLLNENNDIMGYTIHSYGYGYDHDPNLMSNIASQRDGSFYFIEKFETADVSFANALGGLSSVVAENVVITVKPLNSGLFSYVSIEKAFGGEHMWKRTPEGWYETTIKQISSGLTRNYVFTMNLGGLKGADFKEGKIAEAVVSYTLTGQKERSTKSIDLTVRLAENENEFRQQQPDSQLLLNYYRVRTGEALQASSKFADEGAYERGRAKLREVKEELENSGMTNDGIIAGAIKDLDSFADDMTVVNYGRKGKFAMKQNTGAYLEEKSNPYVSAELGSILSNTQMKKEAFMASSRRENTQ